ncbi:MAG: 30S ribosomal protein S15 [Phycisphaerales bacterium]
MPLAAEIKKQTVTEFARHEGDTGSPEVQIALLTKRIQQVAGHMRDNMQDKHTRRGLVMMVGRRNRLLRYLQKTDRAKYLETIQALGLRK